TESLEGIGEAIPLQMLLIPAGTFMMGSPEDEPERQEREGPQHEVSVPPFFMGRYLVTQAQWRVVAALRQVNRELNLEPSEFKGDNLPVEQVSWYEAVEFCDRLTAQTGRPYRLPSEAEWEYACRAGTTTPFHFGKTLTTEVANYDGNYFYADGPKGAYRETTTPVDHFEIANAFGLSDMHGNVWEWCQDHYDSYDKTPIDGSAWVTSDRDARRLLRGGSWFYNPGGCRSAFRNYNTPDFRLNIIGFRVSCSAPRT
ncbi:MAG: hypothetical protein DCF15_07115, partial [Phormidesmis priestleyi]